MKRFQSMLAVLVLAGCASVPPAPTPTADHIVIVRQFVDAFNRKDVDGMARLITPDAQWLSIDGDQIKVEAENRAAIRANMTNYFQSCPSCSSQVTQITTTKHRVSTVEIASWMTPTGLKSQSAFAIYEFDGNLIKRVHYFPEER